MRVSSFEAVRSVAYKELLDGVRHRAGYMTMGMFALTVIAFLSMSLAGGMTDVRLPAALLWVVIFFAATLQGERLSLSAGEGEQVLLGGMLIYDMALTVGASILFDSLWIES